MNVFLPAVFVGLEMSRPAPTMEPTAAPTATMTPQATQASGMSVLARISHYWPPLGGVNCAYSVDGQCLSHTASGRPWESWIDRGCACPQEIPFDTRFTLPDGSTWTCIDRGGAIVTDSAGVIWLDLLQEHASYPFGQVVAVEVQP